MPVQIRYPAAVPTIDSSGLEGGLAALGEKIGQRRQERRDMAEAERLFGQILGGDGSVPNSQGDAGQMSLASLAPTTVITRTPLPDLQDNASRRVADAHNVSDPMAGYFKAIRASESGGDPLAKNPNSSATGLYQFTEGTWNDLVRGNPELGLSADGRTDPRQQEIAVRALTKANAQQLSRGGVKVDPASLYAAHFLGAGGAMNAYGQDDATPMASIVGPEVIEANPFLGNMTVGDFKSWAGDKAGYSPRGGAPSQDALEGLAAGESMPMGGGGAQPAQGLQSISTGGFGVDPKIMAAALKNPYTRPFAIEMAKSRMAAMSDQNDPMKRVAYEKALVDLENARNPRPKMTDDMAEYLYTQKDPQFGQYQIDQKRAASTQVNVGSEKGYDKTVGEGYGKRFMDIQDGAQTAQRAINALDVMEQAMADPGFYSGAGAGTVTNLKRLGRALGMDVEGIADAESFNAMSKQAALDSMGGSLGTGFSNADRDFVLDQVPNLQNTPEGNARLIDIQRKMNMRKQQIAQLAREYAAQNGGRIDAGFDDALSRWSEANPLFPAQPAGSGASRGAGGANGRQRARNPQTGETLEWNGTKWSPVR